MITIIYAYEEAPQSYSASIFLVGPTPRDNDVKSWRPLALQTLSQYANKIDLVVFIPEPRNGVYRSNYLEQVEWEQQHLEMADAIFAWVPRDMNTSLQGLTTNVEFGKYVESGKLFYGRPDNAHKIKYLDWMYSNTTGRQPLNTLTALTAEIIIYLQTKLDECDKPVRKAGERYVPLMIWSTKQFQNWYKSQHQAGNKLVNAKLLWTFIIHKINFTFSYALHVNVWIAAENRIKSNEFIISRPDISVVVPYWKHPTDVLESEIVLVKEFRSPSRTKDSFVYELPGGSSFKRSGILQVASDELYEETSIKINHNRFRYLDSKQLAATWSTHYADVYTVELNQREIEYARRIAASKQTFGVKKDTEVTYVEICKLKNVGKYVDWSMEGMIYRAIMVNGG
jgi:ADP-ribose pyrophosphatase YjhB (NUDIX family)